MESEGVFRRKSDLEYLIDRVAKTKDLFLTDRVLSDLFVANILIEREIENIAKEEYHKIDMDIENIAAEVRELEVFREIKSRRRKGIEVEQEKEGNICLITQKEIEDRVEAPCGHSFSREGVVFLYTNTKGKKGFECPYIGCKSNWAKFNPTKNANRKKSE